MIDFYGQKFEGRSSTITVDRDAIVISYQPLYHAFVGNKRIPFASIAAIQFKEAGSWLVGYIQFTIKGAGEYRGHVVHDENAVQFEKSENASFLALKAFIEEQMLGANASQPSSSVADELTKLAQLRDQGVLSDAEFAQQKAKLLR